LLTIECSVERMRIVMADELNGPKGLPKAIHATFPATTVQRPLVHLIQHSLSEVATRDRERVAAGGRSTPLPVRRRRRRRSMRLRPVRGVPSTPRS